LRDALQIARQVQEPPRSSTGAKWEAGSQRPNSERLEQIGLSAAFPLSSSASTFKP
jgi:hypothetical protein